MVLTVVLIVVVILLVAAAVTLANAVKVLREYERGVVFRLGRLMDQRGPGLQLLVPSIDKMVKISLRTVTLTVPPQEIITRDNVPARVTAVTYYRVIDPAKAVTEVENFSAATLQIAQTSLRSVLGVADLDTLLSDREHLNESLQTVIDAGTEPWGIKVTSVEIKDVEIPERMQHAIARQAEAERERRAKIINAEGEFQAAAKLGDAADVIGRNPVTLQLRYLQTLREIGATQNSTVVFPMPMDVVTPLMDILKRTATAAATAGGEPADASAPGQLPLAPGLALGAGPANGDAGLADGGAGAGASTPGTSAPEPVPVLPADPDVPASRGGPGDPGSASCPAGPGSPGGPDA